MNQQHAGEKELKDALAQAGRFNTKRNNKRPGLDASGQKTGKKTKCQLCNGSGKSNAVNIFDL